MTDATRHETVLITGGAGFIGTPLVGLLAARGQRAIVIDDLSVGRPLPAATERIVPVAADIRDAGRLAAIFAEHRPQAVVHLAAVHHIPTCEAQPTRAFDVNVMGTQAVLEAAQATGCGDVLLASSGAVYDWATGPLAEDATPLKATDVYSITKLTNEYQAIGWAARTGARAHIARLFNAIGADDPNGHLIPDIMAQLGGGAREATIRLGNTAPRRDYIFVEDIAAGLVAILDAMPAGPPSAAWNICTGAELSVAQLVGLIGELMGVAVAIETDPARVRKIDRLQQLGCPAKTATALGWRARWPAREALARIIVESGYRLADDRARAA